MVSKLSASSFLVLALAVTLSACGATRPPKQSEVPDALSDKGADMLTGVESSGEVKPAVDGDGKSGEEKMHEKCCGQCKAALAKDRTGAAANTIPCTDFTAGLDPFCLEHFRGKKTMASECK